MKERWTECTDEEDWIQEIVKYKIHFVKESYQKSVHKCLLRKILSIWKENNCMVLKKNQNQGYILYV